MSSVVPELTSAIYSYVRSLQLEGTYPNDVGVWPISSFRVAKGWGMPPESVWPYPSGDAPWPPAEPEGIDAVAGQHQLGFYRRVRDLDQCRRALGLGMLPVIAGLDISSEWFSSVDGRISGRGEIVGRHCVCLISYDDRKREIGLANSWGTRWGSGGYGTMSYEALEANCIEAWVAGIERPAAPSFDERSKDRSNIERIWACAGSDGSTVHCCEILNFRSELAAWAIVVEVGNSLEVEELFVLPRLRMRGLSRRLCALIQQVRDFAGKPLRLWVPVVDVQGQNVAHLDDIASQLGLTLTESPAKWAAFIGV